MGKESRKGNVNCIQTTGFNNPNSRPTDKMMKSGKLKKTSLPLIKTLGRKSVGFSHGKKSITSDTASRQSFPRITTGNDEDKSENGDKISTMRFVYSEAVERAFRRCFYSTDFGPISAKPAIPLIDIVQLPQIYDDWLSVKDLLTKKREYLRKLQEENGGDNPRQSRYGRYKTYNTKNRTRLTSLTVSESGRNMNSQKGSRSQAGSQNRLPPIVSPQDQNS